MLLGILAKYTLPYRMPEPFAKDVGEGDGDEEG